jgi:hypothetical protein
MDKGGKSGGVRRGEEARRFQRRARRRPLAEPPPLFPDRNQPLFLSTQLDPWFM